MAGRFARLTSADLSNLRIETEAAPAAIGGLAIIEAGSLLDGSGRLRIDEIRRRLEARLQPELRRRLYFPGLFCGRPVWVADTAFDIRQHVLEVGVPPPGSDKDLLDTSSRAMQGMLDRSRPLWQLGFLTGVQGNRLGVVLKVHHAIADGAAVVAMISSLFDLEPDAADPAPVPWIPGPVPGRWALMNDNVSAKFSSVARGAASLAHPVRAARALSASARDVRLIVQSSFGAPRTSINRPVGPARTTRFVGLDLPSVKERAHAAGGKVNDVVLDLAAGGLRALFEARGELTPGLTLIAGVPVNLRPGSAEQSVGNESGVMLVPLPVGEPEPHQRLRLIVAASQAAKARQRPASGQAFMATVAATHLGRSFFARQRMVNVFVTNVVGPPVPLYILGSRILDVVPFLSDAGNVTVLWCVLSYADRLFLAVTVDSDACPEIDRIVSGMESTWSQLISDAQVAN